MSVVCAKVYKDKIEISADTITTVGYTIVSQRGGKAKLFKENGMIIGSCGSAAERALLQTYAKSHKPESSTEMGILRFIVEFAKWKHDYCGNRDVTNQYLMIYEKKLFLLEGLSVEEINKFYAIGAGMDFAFTALHLGYTPHEAVNVACELSCVVSKPIVDFCVPIGDDDE